MSRISWKPASSIATARSPIRVTSFSRTRAQVRPRICSTKPMMPRRSQRSGIWMPARATGPVSHAITPSRRWLRMLAMNWRTPWPTAPSRLRRKPHRIVDDDEEGSAGALEDRQDARAARAHRPPRRSAPAASSAPLRRSRPGRSSAAGTGVDHPPQRLDRMQHVFEAKRRPGFGEGAGRRAPR